MFSGINDVIKFHFTRGEHKTYFFPGFTLWYQGFTLWYQYIDNDTTNIHSEITFSSYNILGLKSLIKFISLCSCMMEMSCITAVSLFHSQDIDIFTMQCNFKAYKYKTFDSSTCCHCIEPSSYVKMKIIAFVINVC